MNLPSVTQIITVTQIISQVGRYWQNFDNVPPGHLEVARERGIDFHNLAAAWIMGLWIGEIPDNCLGFFKSFAHWAGVATEGGPIVEQTLGHSKLDFTGTPDLIVRMKGDAGLTIVDYKTPRVFSPSWRLQLAAYRELAIQNGLPVERVASLQPHPDGGPAKFTEYTKSLKADYAVFLAALTVWRYYNQEDL